MDLSFSQGCLRECRSRLELEFVLLILLFAISFFSWTACLQYSVSASFFPISYDLQKCKCNVDYCPLSCTPRFCSCRRPLSRLPGSHSRRRPLSRLPRSHSHCFLIFYSLSITTCVFWLFSPCLEWNI